MYQICPVNDLEDENDTSRLKYSKA